MREIKFRAWDKRNNKWIHQDTLILTNAGFYEDFREFDDGNSLFDYEYELMQYTGLKDKNGKRIYEGDLIKREYVGLHPRNIHDFIGAVVYYEGTYFIENPNDKEEVSYLYDEIATNEVIGNIYENPELINS